MIEGYPEGPAGPFSVIGYRSGEWDIHACVGEAAADLLKQARADHQPRHFHIEQGTALCRVSRYQQMQPAGGMVVCDFTITLVRDDDADQAHPIIRDIRSDHEQVNQIADAVAAATIAAARQARPALHSPEVIYAGIIDGCMSALVATIGQALAHDRVRADVDDSSEIAATIAAMTLAALEARR